MLNAKAALVAAALTLALPAYATTTVAEVEPNDSIATAQALPVGGGFGSVQVTAGLEAGDSEFVDFFSFVLDNPLARDVFITATGLDGASPYLSLFAQDGFEYYAGTSLSSISLGSSTLGTYTAAVRRPAGLGAATSYTLLISVIPEPSTWAMMLAGFGMMGYSLRRRRTTVLAVA